MGDPIAHNGQMAMRYWISIALVLALTGSEANNGTSAGSATFSAKNLEITPLHEALLQANLADAKRLITKGADVNAVAAFGTDGRGVTPLTVAASSGYTEIVSLLLSKGANPNYCAPNVGGEDGTALIVALRRRNLDIARLLIEKGADLNALDCPQGVYGERPVRTSTLCIAINHPEILELLLARGADVNRRNEDESTPLMCAVDRGDLNAVEVLLRSGADVDAADSEGHTALSRVLRLPVPRLDAPRVQINIIRLLVDHGADIDKRMGKDNKTFKELAVEARLDELAEYAWCRKSKHACAGLWN